MASDDLDGVTYPASSEECSDEIASAGSDIEESAFEWRAEAEARV